MQISEIVGNPGRYVLHRGGRFCGEAWLLEFRMWLTVPESQIDGVTTCTVSLGSGGETYARFVYSQVSTLADRLAKGGPPHPHQFVVTAKTVELPCDSDESPQAIQVLELVALKLDGKFIEIYHDNNSALEAVERTERFKVRVS